MFIIFATYFPLMGRLMKSSASSVAQVIAFEVFATGAGIVALDGKLLRL